LHIFTTIFSKHLLLTRLAGQARVRWALKTLFIRLLLAKFTQGNQYEEIRCHPAQTFTMYLVNFNFIWMVCYKHR